MLLEASMPSRAHLLEESARVELATTLVTRPWLLELEDLGRRMDEVETRIDVLVGRLLPWSD